MTYQEQYIGRCFHCGMVFPKSNYTLKLQFEMQVSHHNLMKIDRLVCSNCYEHLKIMSNAYWGAFKWVGLK